MASMRRDKKRTDNSGENMTNDKIGGVMKNFWKRFKCYLSLFHFDPGVAQDKAGVWRCKRCGGSVRI